MPRTTPLLAQRKRLQKLENKSLGQLVSELGPGGQRGARASTQDLGEQADGGAAG